MINIFNKLKINKFLQKYYHQLFTWGEFLLNSGFKFTTKNIKV